MVKENGNGEKLDMLLKYENIVAHEFFKYLMGHHMGKGFRSFHIVARDRITEVGGSVIETDF